MDKIAILQEKLARLRELDTQFKIFGAREHRYILNPCMTASEVSAFENKYRIELPQDYQDFLLRMGGSGAGPAYGIEPLSACWDIMTNEINDSVKVDFLNSAFPHTGCWNPMPKTDDEYNEYHSIKQIQGSIAVTEYGCGDFAHLVITGIEKGNIWFDYRPNVCGIRPATDGSGIHLDFFAWYSYWLDESLAKLNG